MRKRGTSQVLWIVIAAILLLIVMIVVAAIFGSGIGNFTKGYKDCSSNQGVCQAKGSCPGKVVYIASCPEEDQECCFNEK